MSIVFIDTSAIYALLDADDINNKSSGEVWKYLLSSAETLLMTNYILIEVSALVQRRLGFDALHVLYKDIFPIIKVEWINEDDHKAGVAAFLSAHRKKLSLVDCTSFHIMRRLDIDTAFVFDRDFEDQGFKVLPNK